MSDAQGMGVEDASMVWRVKKAPDGAVYGPVDTETLKEWANSAQIAPEDEIDESDDSWRPAPLIDFLEMIWLVNLPAGEVYGPTTVGTLREFMSEKLVTEKTLATHAKTSQSLPLAALVAAVEFEQKRNARRPTREGNKSTASLAVERAKDQHIRQLEEDLKELRREHEILVHKYRQLSLHLLEGAKTPIPTHIPTPTVVKSGNLSKTGRILQ
jgi:ribosomal protein L19E